VLGTPPAFVLSQDQTLQKLFKAEASFLNVDWLLMFKPIFARPVRQGLTRRFDEAFLHLSMFTSHGVPVQFSKSDYEPPPHSDLLILAQLM
jgi:hypothetical protein